MQQLLSPKLIKNVKFEEITPNSYFLTPYFFAIFAADMKKAVLVVLVMLMGVRGAKAQQQADEPFRAHLFNKEHKVYLRINFYEQDVVISWQEMFGALPGFLSKEGSNYCWIVTDFKIDGNKAELEITNDYGSEDLTATLTCVNDSVYTLRQNSGSALKFPEKKSWKKLPATITFEKVKK